MSPAGAKLMPGREGVRPASEKVTFAVARPDKRRARPAVMVGSLNGLRIADPRAPQPMGEPSKLKISRIGSAVGLPQEQARGNHNAQR
jgi:hypothetical protein